MNELISNEDIDRIAREELADAFKAIQQPRSDYQIENFVVGEKDTPAMAYAQCVLEMQIKHQSIRRGAISKQKLALKIGQLRATGDEMDELTAQEKEIDLEQLEHAALGALREFRCQYQIFKGFSRSYTYEELQIEQDEYWQKRLVRQAKQDIEASGRVCVGNLDALRQAQITGWDEQGNAQFAQPKTASIFVPNVASLLDSGKAGLLNGKPPPLSGK